MIPWRLHGWRRSRACWALVALGAIEVSLTWGCGQHERHGGDLATRAYELGQNALAERRFDWARKHFAEALEHDPDRVDALRLAGVAWLQGSNQSLAPAIENLRRFLTHRPGDVEASQHLARCLNQLGQHADALAVLAAVDLEASDVDASGRTALALQQAGLLLDAHPAEALRLVQRISRDDPEHHRALALASEAHERLGQLDAAYDLAAESLRRNPLQAQTAYRASRLLLPQGNTTEATRMVARYQLLTAVQESKDTGAATAVERLRRWPELAEQVDPDNPHVAALHAGLLLEAGDPDDARRALEALASSSGLTVVLRLDYAGFLQRIGDAAAAERVLREGLEAAPDHRTLRYQLANLLLQRGELAAARTLAQASLDAEPHLGRHYHLLAQIALAEGHMAAAREALAQAVARAPWKATWRAQALDLMWQAGERDAAEALLADAPEPDPVLDAFARQAGLAGATAGAS